MSDLLDHPAAIDRAKSLTWPRSNPTLRRHFPNEAGTLPGPPISERSIRTDLLITARCEGVVLRRPPFGSKVKSAHDMGREFRVLSKLHSVYAPAPKCFYIATTIQSSAHRST